MFALVIVTAMISLICLLSKAAVGGTWRFHFVYQFRAFMIGWLTTWTVLTALGKVARAASKK